MKHWFSIGSIGLAVAAMTCFVGCDPTDKTGSANKGAAANSGGGGVGGQTSQPFFDAGGVPASQPTGATAGSAGSVQPDSSGAGGSDPMSIVDAGTFDGSTASLAGTGGSGGAGTGGGGEAGTGAAGGDSGAPYTGPPDGDPGKPLVEIAGVPCGVPTVGWGSSPPTVQITNREVVVAYPCAHEGAPVTFFLFLHGTVQEEMKVPFTMNAFAVHELVDSHNIIVVVPKAIGTQWGNGDNGQDLPHLYEVVDWVYDTFGSKFNLRSMWAQGGSWGAFYLASTFACDPRFEGRLRGVQMVVGGGCPRCSDRLSCQVAQQELEKGGGSPVSDAEKEALSSGANIDSYAAQHGCDPKTGPFDVGPAKQWTWPSCDPGWVHSYYLGPGNHADTWDRAVVLKMTEEMKSTEQ